MAQITHLATRRTNRANQWDEARYLSCAETAKLVRAELKQMFPGVKFRVTSKTYSGGASITVSWMDGPASERVKRLVEQYEGASFDGMIDLKEYHMSRLNGELVRFGADFVHAERHFSTGLMERAARAVCRDYGWELPAVLVTGEGQRWESAYVRFAGPEPRAGGEWGEWSTTLIYRKAHELEG